MPRRLPPLNSLRAFEAAARLESFKDAADELGVTPAAISQQIRALEEAAGQPLFHRRTRAIELTDRAAAALPLLTQGLDRLEEGAARLLKPPPKRLFTVSTPPSFAAMWLLPRIERFRAAHPELDLRIDADNRRADLARGGRDAESVDVAVRYGSGEYEGLISELLIADETVVVAAPSLIEAGPPLNAPVDLQHHTLLHAQWRSELDLAPRWEMWLKAAGLPGDWAERGPRFNVDSLVVQAAIAGQGVALVGTTLVEEELAAGRLVQPFPTRLAATHAFRYHLVYPPERAGDARISAFRDWIMEEAGR